ncbi:MAG: hypothetical protein ABIO24_14525 [Saprospiraceae bacterium]
MQPPIQALIISNGIEGLANLYRPNAEIHYDWAEVGPDFHPDLTGYDLLIVPNGADHVAMYRIREQVQAFLAAGGTLFCFDDWFTDWVPGHRWIMDNTQKSMDVRYKIKDDPFGLARQFRAEDLNFSHGISGWWSCGYIEATERGSVFLEDTWGRPLVVIDDTTTNGLMVLTASGPAADISYATTDDDAADRAMTELYRAFLTLVPRKKQLADVQ